MKKDHFRPLSEEWLTSQSGAKALRWILFQAGELSERFLTDRVLVGRNCQVFGFEDDHCQTFRRR